MNTISPELLVTAQPLRGQSVEVGRVGNYGSIREYSDYNSLNIIRHFSTDDIEKLKPALEILLCSGLGFVFELYDMSYKLNEHMGISICMEPGKHLENDKFIVLHSQGGSWYYELVGEALDKFFELWTEYEIGDYWIYQKFSGSGAPMKAFEED